MERAFLKQGNHEFKQGKYRAAIKNFNNAIARNPQSVEAYYRCGLAAEKLGRQELAQNCFTEVVKLKSAGESTEAIALTPLTTKTTSLKTDSNSSQGNSIAAKFTLFCILLTMILRTFAFISYLGDQPSSNLKSYVNYKAKSLINATE